MGLGFVVGCWVWVCVWFDGGWFTGVVVFCFDYVGYGCWVVGELVFIGLLLLVFVWLI